MKLLIIVSLQLVALYFAPFTIVASDKATSLPDTPDSEMTGSRGQEQMLCKKKPGSGIWPPATFYLWTLHDNGDITFQNMTNIKMLNFSRPIRIVTHGYGQNAFRESVKNLSDVLVRTNRFNVLTLDYSKISGLPRYIDTILNLYKVGDYASNIMIDLNKAYNFDLKKIIVIGNSLGAHTCSHISRYLQMKTGHRLARIIVLDPATAYMENNLFQPNRLSVNSASNVVVVHTDTTVMGYVTRQGAVDFYVNGGYHQPGCPTWSKNETYTSVLRNTNRDGASCSHRKAVVYFIDSVTRYIPATKCDSWDNFKAGKCDDNEVIRFGFETSYNTTGKFYLGDKELYGAIMNPSNSIG